VRRSALVYRQCCGSHVFSVHMSNRTSWFARSLGRSGGRPRFLPNAGRADNRYEPRLLGLAQAVGARQLDSPPTATERLVPGRTPRSVSSARASAAQARRRSATRSSAYAPESSRPCLDVLDVSVFLRLDGGKQHLRPRRPRPIHVSIALSAACVSFVCVRPLYLAAALDRLVRVGAPACCVVLGLEALSRSDRSLQSGSLTSIFWNRAAPHGAALRRRSWPVPLEGRRSDAAQVAQSTAGLSQLEGPSARP